MAVLVTVLVLLFRVNVVRLMLSTCLSLKVHQEDLYLKNSREPTASCQDCVCRLEPYVS